MDNIINIYNARANLLLRMNKYKQAIESCSNALNIDSTNIESLNIRIELYLSLEKWENACKFDFRFY